MEFIYIIFVATRQYYAVWQENKVLNKHRDGSTYMHVQYLVGIKHFHMK
jgi:hypothetical protein